MPECKNDNDPCDILPLAGEAWSVCLPWGGRIWSDGNGVHATGGVAPPDGVYGKIVIADGCIIGVEHSDVPIYQGVSCADLPGDCGAAVASVMADSPMTMQMDAPVFGEVFIEAGANVAIQGKGTEQDPYVISADTGIYIRSENHAIAIAGKGTRQDPFTVKHKDGHAGTINGMTFDAFGHLTSVLEGQLTGSKGIVGIVPGK